MVGARLGDAYEVVRLLSSGGMGNVYEARHLRLPKRFAVKVVKRELANDNQVFERFWREAQVAASLGNHHLVQVSDFNHLADGTPYMVMEFLEGEDLAHRLARERKLTPAAVVELFDQVVDGLAEAHAHQIVHRDIKPENIFISRDEQGREIVKLLDFGASKVLGGRKLTNDLTAIGTPWYMSPEQARASPTVDHRTDEYALATVLFELLSGKVPYEGDNIVGVMHQIVHSPTPPLRSRLPEAPLALEEVLLKAMSKDPAERFPGVREFWDAARVALGFGPVPRRPISTPVVQAASDDPHAEGTADTAISAKVAAARAAATAETAAPTPTSAAAPASASAIAPPTSAVAHRDTDPDAKKISASAPASAQRVSTPSAPRQLFRMVAALLAVGAVAVVAWWLGRQPTHAADRADPAAMPSTNVNQPQAAGAARAPTTEASRSSTSTPSSEASTPSSAAATAQPVRVRSPESESVRTTEKSATASHRNERSHEHGSKESAKSNTPTSNEGLMINSLDDEPARPKKP
jgi:serine/threonine-protein kinase